VSILFVIKILNGILCDEEPTMGKGRNLVCGCHDWQVLT
jgi:hypothetical protein